MSTNPGSDLVGYLSTKGIRTFKAAGTEVTAHCFFDCSEDSSKGKGKLYLNTDSWLYDCKRCGCRGNRKTLLEHFGDVDDETYLPGTDPGARRKALTEGVTLAQDMLLNNTAVLEYLTGPERGLTEQTIMDAGIGYAPTSWGVGGMLTKTNDRRDVVHAGWMNPKGQEFFSGHILIPYTAHGVVVQVRGRAYVPGKDLPGAKYVTPAGDNVRLYNADALHGAQVAVIVEGEFDCLVLQQALRRSPDPLVRAIAVVAVAGSQTLPEGFASYFEDCKRVYIGLDSDTAGSLGAERMEKLLGSKARRLVLPDALPKCDWTTYLAPSGSGVHSGHTAADVQNLMADADRVGRVLLTPRDASRLLNKRDLAGRVNLGFRSLDMHMGGGLTAGQIVIPIARTGAGKSAWLATVAHNVRQAPHLVVSLELTAAEFWYRLGKIARFFQPNLTEEELIHEYRNVRFFDRRIKPGELTRLCEEFVDDVGSDPASVTLDYIGYAAKAYPGGSQYERTTNCVMSLKEEAKAGAFVLAAPHQAGRGAAGGQRVKSEDARDSGAIEDTADVLMSLYRPSDAAPSPVFDGIVHAEILKNRNGRTGATVPLVFAMASMLLVEKADPAARAAELENDMTLKGDTYSQILAHRQKASAVQLRLA